MNAQAQSRNQASSATKWRERYDRVALIAGQLGRLPRRSDDVDPADVAWIADQRRGTTLTAEQTFALALLPGWTEGTRDGAWYERAEDLRVFILRERRVPRARSAEPSERALAHWYSRQRVAAGRGVLSAERASALDYVTRGFGV